MKDMDLKNVTRASAFNSQEVVREKHTCRSDIVVACDLSVASTPTVNLVVCKLGERE